MRFHSSNHLLLKRPGKDWFMPIVIGRIRLVFALLALAAVNLFRQPAPPQPQTITFDTIPNKIFGISPFITAAKASSGLAVTFASQTTSVCKNSGSLVLLLTPGTCTIQANQAGNTSFLPATVNRSFTVSAAAVPARCRRLRGVHLLRARNRYFRRLGILMRTGIWML